VRIASIAATPVRVPIPRPAAMARTVRRHVSRTIVEIATDDGLSGVGETRGELSAGIIADRFAPALLGLDVADRHAARQRCLPDLFDYGLVEQRLDLLAYSAIDLALWDLQGKACGMPVYRLLGGAARERAHFVAYAYNVAREGGQPEADVPGLMADLIAERIAASGANTVEFKVGLHSVACDIATVRRVRQAVGPAIAVRLDANMGMSLATARRFLDGAADCGIDNFEEPTPRLSDLPRLQREYRLSTSTHCTDFDALTGATAVGGEQIDAVVSDLHYHGGIQGIRDLAVSAVARGHRFWLRSSWELGISWAAMCHVALAYDMIEQPSQCLIDWIADDLTEGEPWLLKQGCVRPPDLPGLGVTLDRAAVARFAVQPSRG
jgi:glucarate dehydratase